MANVKENGVMEKVSICNELPDGSLLVLKEKNIMTYLDEGTMEVVVSYKNKNYILKGNPHIAYIVIPKSKESKQSNKTKLKPKRIQPEQKTYNTDYAKSQAVKYQALADKERGAYQAAPLRVGCYKLDDLYQAYLKTKGKVAFWEKQIILTQQKGELSLSTHGFDYVLSLLGGRSLTVGKVYKVLEVVINSQFAQDNKYLIVNDNGETVLTSYQLKPISTISEAEIIMQTMACQPVIKNTDKSKEIEGYQVEWVS